MNTNALLLASLLVISKISFSQKKDSLPCPKLVLDVMNHSEVFSGQEAVVRLKAFKKNTIADSSLSFKWFVDKGVITKGQNSREVNISTNGLEDQQLKAVIMVDGLSPNCPNTANIVIPVRKDVPIRTETKISTSPNGSRF